MEKIMALIMEVLLNNTDLSTAVTEVYGKKIAYIPDLSSEDTFEGKGKLIYNFLLDNKELLAIKSDFLNIKIDELLEIIKKLNEDSDTWDNPDDVFKSIAKLGLLANMELNDEVVQTINDIKGLEQYIDEGINLMVKQVPLIYRPVLKNKIKQKIGGK